MKKRKLKKSVVVVGSILIFLCLSISLFLGIYNLQIGPVSKNATKVPFEVPKSSTYLTIADDLKEKHLIKDPFYYKLYIRLNHPKELQAGKYLLDETMGVKGIIEVLESGSNYNPDVVTLQVPEGKTIEEVAEYASEVTNNTKEELLSVWDSEEFVKKAMEEYWFVTEDVLNPDIRHPLEGYLFPSTYELSNKDVDAEYIAGKMLSQMGNVLEKYKADIEQSEYSIHELLTMASIVEYEAILDEDRPMVSGVFYNRLKEGMKFQSCATLGYAIDEWKITYSQKDLETDSPYNTYYYEGFPVGPGGMPSKESIEAAIYPTSHDYFYFMANVCDVTSKKTYFSKTLEEHEEKVRKYLTCL